MNARTTILLGLLLAAAVAERGEAADVAAKKIRFQQRPTQVLDQVVQTVDVQIEVETTITQSGQVAHQSTALQHRQVERMIEVKQVAEGQIRTAEVAFRTFRKRSPENKDLQHFVAAPVEGKVYRVTRDGKKLIVTDLDGAIPPQDEYQHVVDNVQTLGLPNPLTDFLVGKTVTVGERLQLPKQIAEKMLNFGSTEKENPLGAIETFELQLTEIKQIEGRQCAVFAAKIVARGADEGPIQMQIAGKFVFETATTRVLSTELHGPITLSVDQGSGQNSFHYTVDGDMKIAIHSQYKRVRK